ncbi:peptidase C45 [Thermoleophilia bacterium SCSIO 60948]|nr:peptidase C45 [Thermoleophilia bacterium SCSIO 60948]
MFPRIRLGGEARERGRTYGSAARELIALSLAGYERAFAHFAGWDWERVRSKAALFADPISDYEPRYLEEIEGIAEGAGVETRDILALNVRTEIMFAATARDADARMRLPAECSAISIVPTRSSDGTALAAQNWDWLPHAAQTLVILEVSQPERPNYATVVEAGLLAKFGLNASGLAVTTNALVSSDDLGRPGVPYHVLLRALHDASTPADGLRALLRAHRSSSANYILTSADGLAIDVEAAPGDFSRAFTIDPADGVLVHTNHFVSPRFDGRDVSVLAMPDSPFRLQRLRARLAAAKGEPLGRDFLAQALGDHAGFPFGVCCHPDERVPEPERSLTLASAIIDPTAGTIALTAGNPCEHERETLDFSDLLGAATIAG